MGIIELIVLLVVLAVVWYFVKAYLIPKLPAPFGDIVTIVLVIVFCLFLLDLIGIGPGIQLR